MGDFELDALIFSFIIPKGKHSFIAKGINMLTPE